MCNQCAAERIRRECAEHREDKLRLRLKIANANMTAIKASARTMEEKIRRLEDEK